MPTYDYQCLECGHEFDAFQHITEEPLKTCPVCGKEVKRLIGAGAGLIFKGSGFYITDYKNKGKGSSKAGTDRPGAKNDKKPVKSDSAPKESKSTKTEKK